MNRIIRARVATGADELSLSYPRPDTTDEGTGTVDPNEVSLRRDQMGRAAGAMLRGGPAPVVDLGEGYWLALSGALSPDMNMALVSRGGATAVAGVVDRVMESGIPTLVMLAGACRSEVLGEPWTQVGEMPFMASVLTSEHLRSDRRVRRAGQDDADVVCQVMAQGFGRAVLAHSLLEAMSEGATIGLLGATPAGKPLYDRTGWTTLENWSMFAIGESAQFSA